MKKKPFSDLIRKAREVKGQSQEELCKNLDSKIALKQGTLSAWETGRQLPQISKQAELGDLAEALDLNLKEMIRALEEQRDREAIVLALSEDELIEEAQAYVDNIGAANLDVWFLGPATLPVIDSPQVRKAWVENILAGANYRILWFLDQISERNLREVLLVLKDIGEKIGNSTSSANTKMLPKEGKGLIWHYGVRAYPPLPSKADSQTSQFALADESNVIAMFETRVSQTWPGNNFRIIRSDDWFFSSEVRRRILSHWQPTSSIVVYSPKPSCFAEPCANLRLKNVYANPYDDGNPVSPFVWLHPSQAQELHSILRQFDREFSHAIDEQLSSPMG